MAALETVTGVVVQINRSGFMLDSEPDVWRNPSKFADPPPAIPALGTRVAVGVDGKGFARTITPLEAPAPNGPPSDRATGGATRDQTITRLSLIKAAARFLADKPDAKSEHVLQVAERWEAWVTR